MVLRAMGPGNRGLAHRLAGEETYAAAIPDADSHQNVELQIVGLAARFAPRQQIDAYHGSNLRIARPLATINEGASTSSFFGWMRGDTCMLANGLATRVLTCEREPTMSSSPGITAEPPVSRMCSMLLYWLEVKKNCMARCTSSARFSRNGCRISASYESGKPPVRLAFSASSWLMPYWRMMSWVSWLPPKACSRVYTVWSFRSTVTF